jgi:GT2 family glycosyltransferase
MTSSLALSVVIPTHNRAATLAVTLDHLALQTVRGGWEVVVVANNCVDDTVALVDRRRSSFPVCLTVIEEHTPGAAAARNAGAHQAAGGDLLFVDDDILVVPECVERLFQDREQHPGDWLVGQVFPLAEHGVTPFGTFRTASMPPVPRDELPTEVQWFASGIALVPKHDLLALGGYQQSFTTAALEDADLAIRARQAGHTILFDPGLVSHHNDWAGTSIRDFCDRARRYCATASQLEERFGSYRHPWSELIDRNRPPRWSDDSPYLIARKLLKALAGTDISLLTLLRIAERLERFRAPPPVLWPVYRAAIAGSMYAGYQEGLRTH